MKRLLRGLAVAGLAMFLTVGCNDSSSEPKSFSKNVPPPPAPTAPGKTAAKVKLKNQQARGFLVGPENQ
jgi:hypothetical protein